MRYGDRDTTFSILPAIKNTISKADLAILGNSMLRLYRADSVAVLSNFKASDTPFVLTWPSEADNRDYSSGHFRSVGMCRAPNPPAPLALIAENEPVKSAGLWRTVNWPI